MTSSIRPSWKQGFARSAAESAYPGLWRGLRGLWVPALGPTGATLRDVSGRHNHGTLTGMDPATDWVAGNPNIGGYALDFDGSNDYVLCDRPISFGGSPNTLTASAWIKVTDGGLRQTILGHNNEASVFQLEIDSKTGASAWIAAIIPGTYVARAYLNWPDSDWHHVAYTRSGTGATHTIYFDGAPLALTDDNTNAYVQPTNATEIGRRASGSQQLDGQVAFLSVYNRALTPTEIQFQYERPPALLVLRRRVFAAAVAGPAAGNPWYYYAQQA